MNSLYRFYTREEGPARASRFCCNRLHRLRWEPRALSRDQWI